MADTPFIFLHSFYSATESTKRVKGRANNTLRIKTKIFLWVLIYPFCKNKQERPTKFHEDCIKEKKKEKKTVFSHKIRFEEILVLACSSSCQCLGWAVAASTRWHPWAAGAWHFLSCQPWHNAAGPADGSKGEGSGAAFLLPGAVGSPSSACRCLGNVGTSSRMEMSTSLGRPSAQRCPAAPSPLLQPRSHPPVLVKGWRCPRVGQQCKI